MVNPIAADDVRPVSRRRGERAYFPEHTVVPPVPEHAGEGVARALAGAGRAASALRNELREHGIDPKLARLVLLLDGRRALRVADLAWRLAVSCATASRLLDRAERAGLVDKLYLGHDRRGTWARCTAGGRELRLQVLAISSRLIQERPAGPAYGRRAANRHDP